MRWAATFVEAVANESGVVLVPFWGHWVQWFACVVQPFWVLQKGLIDNIKQLMEERKRSVDEK